MKPEQIGRVDIRPWAEGDLPLLERLMGDANMMEHLGGPETPEKIRERHARYCKMPREVGVMFVIVVGADRIGAGSVGYWAKEWQDQQVCETGWSVLPEFQGHGFASRAMQPLIAHAQAETAYHFMHAFPSIENIASNVVCRKAGFTLQGEVEFEYPIGHMLRCNDWRLDLSAAHA